MKKALLQPLIRLFFQVLLLLVCYFISRSIFTLINLEKFDGLTIQEFFRLSFFALRYDLSAIVSINGLYFTLLLLPLPIWRFPVWDKFLQWLFVVTNAIAFAFEISDWAYFPFILKRSTIDVLDMISRKGDFLSLLPHFLVTYWYAPLGFALLVFGFYKLNKWICRKTPLSAHPGTRLTWGIGIGKAVLLILVLGVSVVIMRGGLQLVPIGNGNALQVADNKFVPIVLNTPFSMMHSYSGQMEELTLFPPSELKKYFNPVKDYSGKPFQQKNVVFIILEGFSKEYTGLGGRTSYTPFLDSLMGHSFVCANAYANALQSAKGIPAILSGVPSLMDEPITTSAYGTNKLTSLPALLRDKGYQTSFYHGGTNGTMGFDIYAANAGFQRYYGRTEYNDESDYDGSWGIWDEPFLQYFAKDLNQTKQPFMSAVFTLTSHDPFEVPQKYKNILPKGKLEVEQTIAYTDLSLRKFFQTASTQPWFNNTLFVLMADHCSPRTDDKYYSSFNMGMFAIPIIFYAPGDSTLKGHSRELAQQIDILPSVLDYLGYSEKFFAFGNSIFREANPRYVVYEHSGNNYWFMNDHLLVANNVTPKALYDFKADSLCRNNILKSGRVGAAKDVIPYFQAFMQLYRYSVIHNKLTISNDGATIE